MSEFYDLVLEDLDLRNKLILDAAVGAGEATYFWAKRIYEQGGTSKIIYIDNDLPGVWKEKIQTRLGEYGKYVEYREDSLGQLQRCSNKKC